MSSPEAHPTGTAAATPPPGKRRRRQPSPAEQKRRTAEVERFRGYMRQIHEAILKAGG